MTTPISNLPAAAAASQPQGGAGKLSSGGNAASLLPFGDLLASQQNLFQQLLNGGDGGELQAALGQLMQQVEDGELDLEALADELGAADLGGAALPLDGNLLPLARSGDAAAGEATLGGVAAALGWRQMLAARVEGGELASGAAGGSVTQPVTVLAAEQADSGEAGLFSARSPLVAEAVRGEFAAAVDAVSTTATVETGDSGAGELVDFNRLNATLNRAADSRSPALQLSITPHTVDDPAWSEAVGARIHWMAGNGVQNATLKLNPEELGGIHVQLSMQGDRASVQFHAQQQDTSELIEKMLPRLNQAMEQQGMRLDEVKVSHQPGWGETAQQQAQQQGQQSSARAGQGIAQLHRADTGAEGGAVVTLPGRDLDSSGSLDAYA